MPRSTRARTSPPCNFIRRAGKTYLYYVATQLTGTAVRYVACGPDGFGEAADAGVAGSSSFAVYPSDAGTYFYYVVAPSSIVRAPMDGTAVLLDSAESVRVGSNNVAMPGFDIYGSALYYSWNTDICSADAPSYGRRPRRWLPLP